MKKLFLSGLSLLFLGATLVGCAGNNATTTTSTTEVTPTTTTTVAASTSTTVVDEYVLKGIMPGGAPAVAFANYVATTNTKDNYTVVSDTTLLQQAFAKGEQDIVVAPINMGANLYSKGKSTYKLASVLTWGNLYFASQKEDFALASMNNSPVTFFGENSINMAIVDYVLEGKSITTGERTYLASTSNTQEELLKNPNAIVLIAEPALSAAKTKKTIKSISVQELYAELGGAGSYPQAGLFVSASAVANHKELVDNLITGVKSSCDLIKTDLDTSATNAFAFLGAPGVPVLKNAIPGSNIEFKKASEVKDKINAVANLKLALFGGALPQDEFYY